MKTLHDSRPKKKSAPPTAAVLLDVSGFTRTSNAIFLDPDTKKTAGFLDAWNDFRNNYIKTITTYGISPAYPANRMGDGFITLFYARFQVAKRVIHLVWRMNRYLEEMNLRLASLLPPDCHGLSQLKAAAVFDPIVHELRIPQALVGNKTIDPKDYLSPHFNLLSRMILWYTGETPANSIVVPASAPAFPEGYEIARRRLVGSPVELAERMKGFTPAAVENFLGADGLDLVTIGACHFD